MDNSLNRLFKRFSSLDFKPTDTKYKIDPAVFVPKSVPQLATTSKCGCGRVLVANECPNCGYKR